MKIDVIREAWDKLNPSIKNTASKYIEGRNILIRCLSRNSKRTEVETVKWLKINKITIKGLKSYKPNDND
jgi:hypothetical protein